MHRSQQHRLTTTFTLLACLAFAIAAADANAFVSYVANMDTSAGNPMTDVIILEEDAVGQVHLSLFGSDLPGFGPTVIGHDPGFDPVRSLILGLTDGVDDVGAPKTQLMAFLDPDFAAANVGRKWSEIFVGTRHSLTINSIVAAVAGDATEQAWFTDTFYPGPAAGASFATGGMFTVGEFTGLDVGGSSAVMGNWTINSLTAMDLPGQTSGNLEHFVIDETAQVDLGPFDIELSLLTNTSFGVDKTVLNDTGIDWDQFVMELGTKVNDEFIPSTPVDGLGFVDSANYPIREETGAFPGLVIEEDRIVFTGALDQGLSAEFFAFIRSDTPGSHKIALRQYAVPEPASLALLGARAR